MIRALMLGMVTLAGPTPALAAIVTAVYQGTIVEGFDELGLFTPERSDLAGLAFISTFIFDTELGSRFTTPEFDSLEGGEALGVESPVLFAGLTINGTTQEVSGSDMSILGQTGIGYSSFASDGVFDEDARLSTQLIGDARGSGIPPDEIPSTLESTSDFSGSFSFITFDDEGEPISVSAGSLHTDRLTVTVEGVAPVPLPSAGWLLAAAMGLGGASSLWRRSRHRDRKPGPRTRAT